MNTCCVVVSYNPDIAQLDRLCQTLVSAGARVVIVDNTERKGSRGDLTVAGCTVIALGRNTGIAHAQNVGIEDAIAGCAEAVILFDQDSEPDAAFLGHLLTGLTPGKPGVVAPICLERDTGLEMPSYRLDRLGRTHKVFSAGCTAPTSVDMVMASGCAATVATFTAAGRMDEDFFIDSWILNGACVAVVCRSPSRSCREQSCGTRSGSGP